MKSTRLLSCILLVCLFYSSSAQEYSYAHYDIADGLASSTVYCITQDKDGFIWVGTEAGVCRFDGTHFLTYTAADGLPDAEVLQMHGDSKGRVWMAPFGGSVCYFFHGRIHNRENDSVLSRMGLLEDVQHFAEDAHGNILIQQKTSLTLVLAAGQVRRFDSACGDPITKSVGVSRSAGGDFIVQIGEKLYTLSKNGFSPLIKISFPFDHPNLIELSPSWGVWRTDNFTLGVASLVNGRTTIHPGDFPYYKKVSYSIIKDSLLFFNELNGVEEYSLSQFMLLRKFLPGNKVSRTFSDRVGNIWFTTLGNGIYRLKSEEFRTVVLPENGMGVTSVHSITLNRKGDGLLVGVDHDGIFELKLPGFQLRRTPRPPIGINRIIFVREYKDNWFLYGSDANVGMGFRHVWGYLKVTDGIKAACPLDGNRILLGGFWGAGIFDQRKMAISDTIWKGRITAVYGNNDTNYIGTLNGLWRIVGKQSPEFMGTKLPFLRKRISAMAESADGTLWIASNDDSIIGVANGRVITTITKKQGLAGNVCHCLFLHNNILWIGTDKGLNKIALDKPGYPIVLYTSRDGLASDVVNVVYAVGSTIFVGTSAGITYFDETKVHCSDECGLILTAVISSDHNRIGDTARLLLPVRENNIRFEFAGISYRSGGNIVYRYRMIGLDSAWKETQQSFLDYPILPSGKYIFQLQAINKFGIRSTLLSLECQVATPFWKTTWFDTLFVAGCLSLIWLFVSLRIKHIRRQQREKEMLNQRLVELENTALQSQMNPHFIFNCLNSIQKYILRHEAQDANKYLTGFARLIRATLHNSSKAFIPLREEIDYLSTYLSLEKLRFKEKMDFSIETEPLLDKDLYIIPPMLIQPFVENSMRHGLRHKTDGNGRILIHLSNSGNKLQVIVEDNGIGRKKAAEYKTREHIEYQSKGMSLTADRIRMMNTKYGQSIQIEVIDLDEGSDQSAGTRVILRFPLFHQILQNETL